VKAVGRVALQLAVFFAATIGLLLAWSRRARPARTVAA
jgi:hypothetical protein